VFCEWTAQFPTAGTELSLSVLTEKSMGWLPVAKFEHHEERESVHASLDSFHEKLYALPGPGTHDVYLNPPSYQLDSNSL
jgi:hypothetical protein